MVTMNEKYRYLGKNTLIFAISSFGTKFLSFFLVPLYTNILTTEEYGIADLITTTATLMIFIFTVNISDSVLRFAINKEKKKSEILAYGIKVLVTGSLILMGVLIIVYRVNLIRWPRMYYIFIFLYFFFTALYQILSNYLRAIDSVTDVAIAGIISALIIVVCNIMFLLVIKTGIYGYLVSLTAGPAIASLYALIKIKISVQDLIRNVCNDETKKEMYVYGIPLIFNNIALWINAFLDKYFVTAICGTDQNGIYSIAYKIPTILTTCYTVFSQAWNLSAIKEFDKDDKEGFFSETYSIYNALIAIICSGLILINIPLARILYAKNFFEASNYSSVLLVSVMFNALTIYLGSIFSAVKRTKVIAVTTIISAAVNTLLNMILIPLLGVLGAAIATAIAYGLMWAFRLMISRLYIKLKGNYAKDILVYIMICSQVVLEHLKSRCYMGQFLVFMFVIICYRKYVNKIWSVFVKKMRKG